MKEVKSINNIISDVFAMEQEEAKEAGALAYMARSLVQATMPHSKQNKPYFVRKNGDFSLAIMAHPDVGLPYGSIPRLLMTWLTTEAVKTKSRELVLGDNLSDFMRELEMVPTGGRWGTITSLKNQMKRLFSCSISCTYTGKDENAGKNLFLVDDYHLWWSPKEPEQAALFQSVVILSQNFYNEIIHHPVPIDLRAIKALRRSPMALDIYCWLTYRNSYLKSHTLIPWEALELQFGAEYNRTRDFKAAFIKHLKKVGLVYKKANVGIQDEGLLIKPSVTHIRNPQLKVNKKVIHA